jgi:hypothetical protein
MSWSFSNLPYGWKIATGVTLSALTIYLAGNVRQRINQVDEIELDLAVAERCLATQYGTNSDGTGKYYVSPPEYARSWYSNSYELCATTNGTGTNAVITTNWVAVLHTNVFTNAVGYRTDRAKAVARDATIKALVPYYCDPDTVYDGTTNIVMLTVTGLWASLQIGDKTNLFTREPEWVEIVGTNIITNAATYGELPWRIYKTDLEERYKVLNALKFTRREGAVNRIESSRVGNSSSMDNSDSEYLSSITVYTNAGWSTIIIMQTWRDDDYGQYYESSVFPIKIFLNLTTNIEHKTLWFYKTFTTFELYYWDNNTLPIDYSPDHHKILKYTDYDAWTFDSNLNDPLSKGPNYNQLPVWGEDLTRPICWVRDVDTYFIIDWNFQYCTNKYW